MPNYIKDSQEKFIIKQINKALKCGTTLRQYESYDTAQHFNHVNCFFHACYNFPNKDLDKLVKSIGYEDIYNDLPVGFDIKSIKPTKKHMLKFIKKSGLKVKKYKPKAILKSNQHVVALYFAFSNNPKSEHDFHFLIQEKNGAWTGKKGYSTILQKYKELPKEIPLTFNNPYKLEDIFIITNPYQKNKDEIIKER